MFKLVFAVLLLAPTFGAKAALTSRPCDPVWEIPRPIYKKIKGPWVRVGWYCELQEPNGGPSTGGSGGGGG